MANEKKMENPAAGEAEKSAGRSSRQRNGRQNAFRKASQSEPKTVAREEGKPQTAIRGGQQVKPQTASGNERQPAQQAAVRNGRRTGSRSGRTKSESERPTAHFGFNLRWTWREYALQLSVVIIGVMVTFIGSGVVERWRMAREVRTVMQLVYEELKTDRKELEDVCERLRFDRQGMLLFQDNNMDIKRIPADSLGKYQPILGNMEAFTPRSDALEVLRSSGVITSVDDKQLLMNVMESYSWMKNFAATIDIYNTQKMNALNHLFSNGLNGVINQSEPVQTWTLYLDDTLCCAFMGTMASFFGRDVSIDGKDWKIDRAIEGINEKYGFEKQDSLRHGSQGRW